jgi:hypothetical protein
MAIKNLISYLLLILNYPFSASGFFDKGLFDKLKEKRTFFVFDLGILSIFLVLMLSLAVFIFQIIAIF